MSSLVLGIDIGTTSVSIVAIADCGQVKASTTLTHGAAVAELAAGCAEQSPDLLWQAVVTALRSVSEAICGSKITAIGMTGQMHSTLLLNDTDESCSNVITWQDKRAVVHQSGGSSLFEQLLSRVSSEDMEPTGCRLAPGYMGTTLFALRQLGELPPKFSRTTFVADWIAGRLCEQVPVTDRSHAASSGLYDFHVDDWSSQLLNATGVDASWLPEVRSSGTVIGEVTQDVAAATGLPAGTKVCNAIGDNQAAVLSSLPDDNGALLINIGTGGQIVWRVPSFQRIDGMDTRYLPSAVDHHHEFMLVGAGLAGGDAFAWINRTVRQWLQAFGIDKSEDEIWKQLARQVAELPADVPPIRCEPFFAGTRPDPSRRAVFDEVGLTNFTPANIARSILQGIAETMHGVYESAIVRPEPLQRIIMSGNGSRQNPLLAQAVAERFGVSAAVAPCNEEAATGAAMLAGVRTGVWTNLQTAQQNIHDSAANSTSTGQ